jgi:hypothetical protein
MFNITRQFFTRHASTCPCVWCSLCMVQCAGCAEEAAHAFVRHTFQGYGDLVEATAYLMLGAMLSGHKD